MVTAFSMWTQQSILAVTCGVTEWMAIRTPVLHGVTEWKVIGLPVSCGVTEWGPLGQKCNYASPCATILLKQRSALIMPLHLNFPFTEWLFIVSPTSLPR